jgi:SRSO17 transposase
MQPMAARDAGVSYDQLHHFIASGVWDAAPLEAALLAEADRQVGGDDAWLIVDDTALPKKGSHSVGVAPQYASALGKNANCQTLVSLTLASGEVPVMVGLRLFLPESWTSDPARLDRAGVPDDHRSYKTKPEIALAEIDRVRSTGVRKREGEKRIPGPPPQPSLPAVRQAILNALAQPPPIRCPHCRRSLPAKNPPK